MLAIMKMTKQKDSREYDRLNTFKKEIAIEYLKGKVMLSEKNFSEAGLFYIRFAKSMLENGIHGLESILNPTKTKGYDLNKDAFHLYKLLSIKKCLCLEEKEGELVRVIEELKANRQRIKTLIENPKEFYKSGENKRLFEFLDKLEELYKL